MKEKMKKIKELDNYLESCGVNVFDLVKTYYFQITMPHELTQNLIIQTDKILENPSSPDYSPSLAGEIYEGKQTLIHPSYYSEESTAEFINCVESASAAYIKRFFEMTNQVFPEAGEENKFRCRINDMWIVSQYANDYNPPHHHRTKAPVGLSGVLYLKIPPQISASSTTGKKDGFFHFSWGPDVSPDMRRLTLSDHLDILPVESTMLLFPKNMCHEVFPFRGEGERRCIAFNVNVFPENA
jgi:hypothetical protein